MFLMHADNLRTNQVNTVATSLAGAFSQTSRQDKPRSMSQPSQLQQKLIINQIN